jgi:hypothetical protein
MPKVILYATLIAKLQLTFQLANSIRESSNERSPPPQAEKSNRFETSAQQKRNGLCQSRGTLRDQKPFKNSIKSLWKPHGKFNIS